MKFWGAVRELFRYLFQIVTRRRSVNWIYFLLFWSVYFALVLNLPFLRHAFQIINGLGAGNTLFAVSVPFVLIAASLIIFTVFCWKYTAKLILVLLTILGSVLFYASWNYGIIYDFEMIRNFAETNPAEAASYFSVAAFLTVIILGILPAIIIILTKVKWARSLGRSLGGRAMLLSGCLAVVGVIFLLCGSSYISTGRNNRTLNREFIPYSFIAAANSYVKHTYFALVEPFKIIGEDATIDNPDERPEIVVLVLGETARAKNYPENGYKRNTTEYTQSINDYITFSNVQSCGTSTAQSVPCIFSNMPRSAYSRSRAERVSNLLDVVTKAGFGVAWIENDGGCQGVCDRLPAENVFIVNPGEEKSKYCEGDNCFDEILVEKLPQAIDSLKTRNRFIIVHVKGSHGPTYLKRMPAEFKKFTPSCERADIQACSQEELVNIYDNTILYTDHVLKDVHDKLQGYGNNFGSAMIYVSDHGESLGEYGLYLHGMPYSIAPEEQTHVPLQMWFSPAFAEDHALNTTCMQEVGRRNGVYSHDNLFHSLLGILDVETRIYDPKLDFFVQCRNLEASKIHTN